MLLAIDVGNSHTVFGVFDSRTLVASWRIATVRDRTSDELGITLRHLFAHHRLDQDAINGIVLASVVPQLTGTIIQMGLDYFDRPTFNIEPESTTALPIRYDKPSDVGADRIVNAVAAIEQYATPSKKPLIVVDFGTATTFDAISVAGEYLGGVICPGVQISADALFQRAARLPRVDVQKPPRVIGRSTVESMQAGLFFGYVAMVEGLVARMKLELGPATTCVATGGLADIIARETEAINAVNRDLTLQGLRILWERHAGGASRVGRS